jgi:chromate reductase, NAD(P)H dehydrogenase (quinone)
MAFSILGISGSLRAASFNTGLLRAAQELAPEGMTVEIADISAVPLYNEEIYQAGFPAAVEKLRQQVAAADAVILATPEYNFSISGPMKNAIDWISRPPVPQAFDGKPVAIMGAAGGKLGTARAQYHLRQVMVFLNAHVINKPEVMVGGANGAFADGKLTDETARDLIRQQLEALQAFAKRLS